MLIKNKVQNLGVAVIATLVGAAFFGSTAFAYGPERQTFTAENPADHVTFNSITNIQQLVMSEISFEFAKLVAHNLLIVLILFLVKNMKFMSITIIMQKVL